MSDDRGLGAAVAPGSHQLAQQKQECLAFRGIERRHGLGGDGLRARNHLLQELSAPIGQRRNHLTFVGGVGGKLDKPADLQSIDDAPDRRLIDTGRVDEIDLGTWTVVMDHAQRDELHRGQLLVACERLKYRQVPLIVSSQQISDLVFDLIGLGDRKSVV